MIDPKKISLNELKRKLRSIYANISNKPHIVHISITDKCNLKCKYCDIWKKPNGKELTTEEWKKIISDLRIWLGPFILKISGGEPFVRKDIVEIVKICKANDLFVGISTNGTLITEELTKDLISAGLDEINISLDSIEHSIQDFIKNKKGACSRILKTISYFKNRRGKTILNIATVISEKNYKDLIILVNWIRSNKLNSIYFQPLYQNFGATFDSYWYKKSSFFPQGENISITLDNLIKEKKKDFIIGNTIYHLELMKKYFRNPSIQVSKKCNAGKYELAIDPYGNMMLCFNLPPLGNLKQKNAKTMYKSRTAKRLRKIILNCKKNCNLLNCNFKG